MNNVGADSRDVVLNLLSLNQKISSDRPLLNQGLGGNISVKLSDSDLIIKPSGKRLHELNALEDFSLVHSKVLKRDLRDIAGNAGINEMQKEIFYSEAIERSRADHASRPSMEVGFHVFLRKKYILHFHHLNSIVATAAEEVDLRRVHKRFFDEYVSVFDYQSPGWRLTELLMKNNVEKPIIILKNHGVIVQIDDPVEFSIFEEYHGLCRSTLLDWVGSRLTELESLENLIRLPAHFKVYYPDIAILGERIKSILVPAERGGYILDPNARFSDSDWDIIENWAAIVYLSRLGFTIDELSSVETAKLRQLPTEIARMKRFGGGNA